MSLNKLNSAGLVVENRGNKNSKHKVKSTIRPKKRENLRDEENLDINDDEIKVFGDKNYYIYVYIFLLICMVCVIGVNTGILRNTDDRLDRHHNETKKCCMLHVASGDVKKRVGILKHVNIVLKRVGYEICSRESSWNLLWAHDYPFSEEFHENLHLLKPHQRVNHFPGLGSIIQKVQLAITDSKYIPKAFKLPDNKDQFLKYASENKNALFLEKLNTHRGVHLKNVSAIDLTTGKSFVQEYVQNPFLVDGHKFDIGVYVAVTSVNPLRLYWYKGDVLFRYCPEKYYPFINPLNADQYVVMDNYMPTWEVLSLMYPYTALGASMKDVFDVYAQSKGKNTTKMWKEIQKAIVEVFLKNKNHIVKALEGYPSQDNFFEMLRFDLIVDEDLRVYLLEANMSPNLSSAHFPPNQLLYEQLLYNLFSLTGITNQVSETMVSAQKNIAVWTKECSTTCKKNCEHLEVCKLCRPCIDGQLRNSFLKAHREFLHKGDFRRLFPPPMEQRTYPDAEELEGLSAYNKLQYLWYQGKCNVDVTWCN